MDDYDDSSALLDDIFASVDAAENPDVVANSCDEESDLDEPKELPPTQTVPAITVAAHARFAGVPKGTPLRRPLGPATTTRSPALLRTPVSAQRAPPPTSLGGGGDYEYWMVQWRKPQQRKHKTWDGDAFLRISGQRASLYSEEGKFLGSSLFAKGRPSPGMEFKLNGLDCEVDRPSSREEFDKTIGGTGRSGPAEDETPKKTPVTIARAPRPAFKSPLLERPYSVPIQSSRLRGNSQSSEPPTSSPAVGPSTPHSATPKAVDRGSSHSKPAAAPKPVAPSSRPRATAKTSPKKKLHVGSATSGKDIEAWGGALHDPNAPGAVVMERPPAEEAEQRGTTINDVVLDPMLSKRMREHQKEGVKFMYRCVMGMTGSGANGCILADEMGLGKTLQTIALIHTLCRQSPFLNESQVIGRALVVCPATLINNWKKEFTKWAGPAFRVLAMDEKNDAKITNFTHNRGVHVLIISYERLRNEIKQLQACQPKIDLIVCDEGHRLKKSGGSKTSRMFDELHTSRRIILSGTPVQNDLGEYWAMANFVCPGIMGTYSQFQKQYENPIVRARATSCTQAVAEKGRLLSKELRDLSLEFLLRRTADVLTNYLPTKTEYVVFVAPTQAQLEVYHKLLGSAKMGTMIRQFLPMIAALKKVANSPALLHSKKDDEDDLDESELNMSVALSTVPRSRKLDISLSGKLMALDRILKLVHATRDEKVVVVSSWTATLDMIEELCNMRKYRARRLDGSTPQKQRQELVDSFNRESRLASMVFLLSTKAGGAGINLIGASRLVLFDSDWNPAHDLQAMGRIHRDGQKKQVYIYRLLTANTIDEKIYQRQLTKVGLSDQMMGQGVATGGKDSKDSFSTEELRDIFTFRTLTGGCQTHDLLECNCQGKGTVEQRRDSASTIMAEDSEDSDDDPMERSFVMASQYDGASERRKEARAQRAKLAALKEWSHVNALDYQCFKHLKDTLLHNDLSERATALPKIIPSVTIPANGDAADDPPPRKKTRRVISDSEGSDTEPIIADHDGANDSINEDEDGGRDLPPIVKVEGDITDVSDDEDPPRPSLRVKVENGASREGSVASAGRKRRADSTESGNAIETYDLRELADQGHGGRVLFVFEKVAKPQYG